MAKEWGLPINPLSEACGDIEQVLQVVEKWQVRRNELPYEIDGLVIKVDDLAQRFRLAAQVDLVKALGGARPDVVPAAK